METWTLTGVVLRGYLKILQREGLLDQVRALVPESTRALMDKPPLVVSSVSGTVLDDIMVAVEKVRGAGAPRAIARKTAHDSFGPVLKSLMQSTLGMFGSSPGTLFERMGGISPLMVRHIDFAYRAGEGRSGTVACVFPSAPPRASLAAWEGICEFVLDFCGRAGAVAPHRALEGGRRLEIDVRWEPRAGAPAEA